MSLPHYEALLLEPVGGVLRITLDRPQNRDAMSLMVVGELRAVLATMCDDRSIRTLVLRGADRCFCTGGGIKDMAGARAAGAEAYRTPNRAFGSLLEEAQAAPQLLMALVEGAVLGGGFGLAYVSDVAIAAANAQFGLPETSLGILPAQVAPPAVRRIDLTQTRRLAPTAARFDGREALCLDLIHFCEAGVDTLEQRLEETLEQLRRRAPNINAATKALLLASRSSGLGALLDDAARQFTKAVGGAEDSEGTLAFVQKRKPAWAQ